MNPSLGVGGEGRRWTADLSLRRSGRGRIVLGGSPLKLFRLSAAGARLLDRALAGSAGDLSPQEAKLLDRLVCAGAIHPEPTSGAGPWKVGDVTVVVPVRDAQGRLEELIPRIWATTPGLRQVIVVDDGSSAPLSLEQLVESHLDRSGADPSVVLLRRTDSGGPGVARNDGLALVETPFVAFIDVDCDPTPGWLDPLLDHFGDPRVSVVAPRIVAVDHSRVDASQESRSPCRQILIAYERERSPLDLGQEPARVAPGTRVSYVPSAALVARAETLRSVGGFDEALRVGEDVDLIWRLVDAGERVRYEPSAKVGHDVRPDLVAWMKQRYAYGTSAAPLASRHGSAVAPAAMSPWSLAVWALAAAGMNGPATAVAAATTQRLRQKLPDVETPEVLRLGVGGHLGAGQQLARCVVRVWWPAAAVGSLLSRRVRRVSGVAALWSVAASGERSPQGAALALLDDLSYGAGVWRGCIGERSARALLPSLRGTSKF